MRNSTPGNTVLRADGIAPGGFQATAAGTGPGIDAAQLEFLDQPVTLAATPPPDATCAVPTPRCSCPAGSASATSCGRPEHGLPRREAVGPAPAARAQARRGPRVLPERRAARRVGVPGVALLVGGGDAERGHVVVGPADHRQAGRHAVAGTP